MNNATPTVDILGVPFARLTPETALDRIEALYGRDRPAFVAHANVHTVNLAQDDRSYLEALRAADLVLNDGKGVMLAAKMLGAPFPADLNGNYMGPVLLQRAADRGWPVYFFGAKPGVAERAAHLLEDRIPGLKVVGSHDGYFQPDQETDVVAEIASASPGLLYVGLGNPAQERWIVRNLDATGAKVAVGVGAFFDFQTGEVKRAPGWMNRIGLEWVHRLFKEPKRMWRRYILGNPWFLWRVLGQRRRDGR